MPDDGRRRRQAHSWRTRQPIVRGAKPLDVDAVGNHAHFPPRKPLALDQVLAVCVGHGDEGVGDRREQAIQPADAVWPARGMQCRCHDRHAGTPGGQPAPEHLVAGADGDHGVGPPPAQQLGQPRQNTRRSVLCDSMSENAGISSANSSPSGPSSFRQHSSGRNWLRSSRRTRLTSRFRRRRPAST